MSNAMTRNAATLKNLISSKAACCSYESVYDLYVLWCRQQRAPLDASTPAKADTATIAVGAS